MQAAMRQVTAEATRSGEPLRALLSYCARGTLIEAAFAEMRSSPTVVRCDQVQRQITFGRLEACRQRTQGIEQGPKLVSIPAQKPIIETFALSQSRTRRALARCSLPNRPLLSFVVPLANPSENTGQAFAEAKVCSQSGRHIAYLPLMIR